MIQLECRRPLSSAPKAYLEASVVVKVGTPRSEGWRTRAEHMPFCKVLNVSVCSAVHFQWQATRENSQRLDRCRKVSNTSRVVVGKC